MGKLTTGRDSVEPGAEIAALPQGASFAPLRAISLRWQRIGIERREEIIFYMLISPWVVGFFLFFLGPLVSSGYYSLTDWNLLKTPEWVGLDNFITMFSKDRHFGQSIGVTLLYTLGAVPLATAASMFVALLLNQRLRGINLYRAAIYVPVVISGVAAAQLWRAIFNQDFGILNLGLYYLGIRGPGWLTDPNWALISLIIISLWSSLGSGMIIFLASLQGIPRHLYEAAEIDGAGRLARFRYVTIPMLSPTILFSLIVNTIGSFQGFTQAFVLTSGGPANSTRVFALYLFQNAFEYFKMGYASALALILLVVMLIVTALQIRLSTYWVYYEGE